MSQTRVSTRSGQTPGRWVVTLSTAGLLFGVYSVYALTVTPLVAPPTFERPGDPRDIPRIVPPLTNLQMAEKYLPFAPWAANAKYPARYQVRTEDSFFYWEKWEQIDDDRAVRFTPFAMIWFQKGRRPDEAPITIVSESASVRFASKFEIARPSAGRIVAGTLEGEVEIRGPDGLYVKGRDFYFVESIPRIWSEEHLRFAYGPHRGRAHAMQAELIPVPGPPGKKLAVSGIRSIRLRRNVVMDLLFEQGSAEAQHKHPADKPPDGLASSRPAADKRKDPVVVRARSAGNFDYDLETHIASFEEDVRIDRPTGPGTLDTLLCDKLTLVFEPPEEFSREPTASAPADGAPRDSTKSPADARFRGLNSRLSFRRLHAEARYKNRKVVLISEANGLTAKMDDLAYDVRTKIARLADRQVVDVVQKQNRMHSPEIVLTQDERGKVSSVWCKGAGRLESRDEQTGRPEFIAEWARQLRKYPDPESPLDVIELEEKAIVRQPQEQTSLAAGFIKLWVHPREDETPPLSKGGPGGVGSLSASGPPPTPPYQGGEPRAARGNAASDRSRTRLDRMLAIDNVVMLSPRMNVRRTKRLEAWFEPGDVAAVSEHNAAASSGKGSGRSNFNFASERPRASEHRQAKLKFERPDPRPLRDGLIETAFRTDDRPAERAKQTPTNPSATRGRETLTPKPQPATPDGPLDVTADLIRVRVIQAGDAKSSKVAEVWTDGNVDVRQEHAPGEEPLHITAERMHIVNRAGDDQVLHVFGAPAHIRDRQLHIEGGQVDLYRAENRFEVNGPGLLQLPVDRTLEGQKLDRPQILDVWWKERMVFDGSSARFYRDVWTVLADNRVRCQEMTVVLANRLSFTERNEKQEAEILTVTCKDGVEFESDEYEEKKPVQIRRGRFASFTMNRQTGNTEAAGPGWIAFWRRGRGKRAGLAPTASVEANRPLQAESAEWEYVRIDFERQALGNIDRRFNTFEDRVRIVYGPVERPPETISPDELPRDGGWMRSDSLTVTQYEQTADRDAYISLLGRGNVKLEGRTFHAQADTVTYDESQGLYVLRSLGRLPATVWKQDEVGGERSEAAAQRIEFIPALNVLKADKTRGLSGVQ